MSRLPIRLRLTAAFALAMVVVLVAAGLFVDLRLQADLDENVDSGLETRSEAVAGSGEASAGATGDEEEGFAQLLGAGGDVLDATDGASAAVLTGAELARVAAGEEVHTERDVAGIEGTARLLAVPATGETAAAVVVGQSLDDRDETLSALVAAFAIGGPIAVVLASLLGYVMAAAGLRPVEAMRSRAAGVSLERDERLPLPAARDEIRRLAETLNEMLDRLRRSYEREASFVADASHELRTPVAVIKTEIEAALRARPAPDVREALVAAIEECDHLAQLAEDLLVVARTAEGGVPVHPGTLEAPALLEGVRERFGDRAAERARTIVVEADAGLLLHADESRLRQALGNLVDNALRYGDGTIVLRGTGERSEVVLEVADAGSGFPPEIAGRAFERFARGDVARTRGGTGLGLAIVRAIAEAHGGRAEIVSDAPGATVRIVLPAAIAASGGSKPAVIASSPQSNDTGGDDA